MADVAQVAAAVEAPTTSKKTPTGKKVKKLVSANPKSTHPPTTVIINGAIKHLKERGGSSLQAIKKYISATYKIDAEKFSPFIKKYLRNSVASGILVQTKGKGAFGSFKLATTVMKISSTTAPKTKKSIGTVKTKASKASEKKTSAIAKKATAKGRKKVTVEAVAVKEVKSKTPSKVKKTAKAPTKKLKSPKAKVTKPTAKKASPKKKRTIYCHYRSKLLWKIC